MTPTLRSDIPDIDISSLDRATSQLEKAIIAWQATPADEFIRDAVIQRFEFTYELSLRTLRRYLKTLAVSDEIDEFSFRELIRRGNELNLLKNDLSVWLDYRKARTDTVHTYNELRAVEVAEATPRFATEVRGLFNTLRERLSK